MSKSKSVRLVVSYVFDEKIDVPSHINLDAEEGTPEYQIFRRWLRDLSDDVSSEDACWESTCVVDNRSGDVLYDSTE